MNNYDKTKELLKIWLSSKSKLDALEVMKARYKNSRVCSETIDEIYKVEELRHLAYLKGLEDGLEFKEVK